MNRRMFLGNSAAAGAALGFPAFVGAHYSTNLSLLGMLSYKLGRSVRWDDQKETCVNDAEANKLLRRRYREPWVYPEA